MMLRHGSTGADIKSLQSLLNSIGKGGTRSLVVDGIFGPRTDAHVREVQSQTPNSLIADGIVGPLTQGKVFNLILSSDRIGRLGTNSIHAGPFHPVSFLAGPSARSVAPAATKRKPKAIVITETELVAFNWAKQVKKAWSFVGVTDFIVMSNFESVNTAATKLEHAARLAGPGGAIWLSVGHGGVPEINPLGLNQDGIFDLAPHGFRVAGRNSEMLVRAGDAQVNVFYDVKPKRSLGILSKSLKDEDEERAKSNNAKIAAKARKRLDDFDRFVRLGRNLRSSGIAGILLVTCNVAQATGFMKQARKMLGVPLGAYKTRVVLDAPQWNSRTRMFLEGDRPGVGTNIPLGEILPPLPPGNKFVFYP